MGISLKSSIASNSPMKSLLTPMAERWVPQIMGKAGTGQEVPGWQPFVFFRIFFVSTLQCFQQSLANLSRLNRVRKAGTVKVTFPNPHYLRLCLESPKCRRVYYTCPVSLVLVAIVLRPRLLVFPDSSPKRSVNHCSVSRQTTLVEIVIRCLQIQTDLRTAWLT